jgi:hypothetical protein
MRGNAFNGAAGPPWAPGRRPELGTTHLRTCRVGTSGSCPKTIKGYRTYINLTDALKPMFLLSGANRQCPNSDMLAREHNGAGRLGPALLLVAFSPVLFGGAFLCKTNPRAPPVHSDGGRPGEMGTRRGPSVPGKYQGIGGTPFAIMSQRYSAPRCLIHCESTRRNKDAPKSSLGCRPRYVNRRFGAGYLRAGGST